MTIGIILAIISALELLLGLKFVFGTGKNKTTIFFGLFALGSAFYVGSNALGFLTIVNGDTAEHLAWAGGVIATTLFLPFSYMFPYPSKNVRELAAWVIWPTIIFIPGLVTTEIFILKQPQIVYGTEYSTATGPYFWLLFLFLIAYWIWSIWNLAVRFKKSDGVNREHLKLVLVGIIVSFIGTLCFDMILPLYGSFLGYVGSIFTIAWLGVTGFILWKK